MTSTRHMDNKGCIVIACAVICFVIFVLGMFGLIEWPGR